MVEHRRHPVSFPDLALMPPGPEGGIKKTKKWVFLGPPPPRGDPVWAGGGGQGQGFFLPAQEALERIRSVETPMNL